MRLLLYVTTLLVMLLLTNCTNESAAFMPGEEPLVGMTDSVAIGLGASFHHSLSGTRMSASATQADGAFRGISDFYMIPYATTDVIGPDDTPLKKNLGLDRRVTPSQLRTSNNFLFYKPVYVPKGTASFLIYGHAPAGNDPFTYGSLSGFDNITSQTKTSDITFSLDQIYSGTDVPAIGQELADYLTGIANIQYALPTAYYGDIFYRVQRTPIYKWNNPDSYSSSGLAEAFEFFTNGDRVMGGSSLLVNSLLTRLYNTLYTIANADPTAIDYYSANDVTTPTGTIYPYRELAKAIRTAIANTDYVQIGGYGANASVILKSPRHDYPASLGLPDGASGLQWNASEQEFQVVLQTKASAKIMSASRFCYPPLLCYYANSRIKTSDVGYEEEHYVSPNTWAQVLEEYASPSNIVNSKTQAVAIEDVINYGVAQFQVKMGRVTKLRDRGEVHEINVNGINFLLTGIIVGPQHHVAYNFDPLPSSDDFTVYDREIENENGADLFLMPYEDPVFQTLVLPTRKDEVVYFVLEFENRSGVDFYGANGLILNGSKFYMTAKLDPKDGTGYNPDDHTLNRIFSQDCVTQINCIVKDLKGAWNVVPDLRDPQLEVGVSMEMKWIQNTTTNLRLD